MHFHFGNVAWKEEIESPVDSDPDLASPTEQLHEIDGAPQEPGAQTGEFLLANLRDTAPFPNDRQLSAPLVTKRSGRASLNHRQHIPRAVLSLTKSVPPVGGHTPPFCRSGTQAASPSAQSLRKPRTRRHSSTMILPRFCRSSSLHTSGCGTLPTVEMTDPVEIACPFPSTTRSRVTSFTRVLSSTSTPLATSFRWASQDRSGASSPRIGSPAGMMRER